MFVRLLVLSCCALLFQACQKSENDLIQEAQFCLNNAPAAQAEGCVDKISALTSPNAYKLKCSAIYISEGFGEATKLIGALDDLSKGDSSPDCSGGTCSSTLVAMNVFNFSQGNNLLVDVRAKNLAKAAKAVTECAPAGVKAYVQISSLFKLGTMAAMNAYALGFATPGQPPTVDQLEDALASLPPAQVGEIVYTTYEATCKGNVSPSESTKKYCDELATSMNHSNGDYTVIGQCLLAKLDNPHYVCP